MFEFFGVYLKHAINLSMWEYCNIIMVHKLAYIYTKL